MRTTILFFVASSLLTWGKACTSAQSGPISSLTTWTAANSCNSLGVVDGDTTVVTSGHSVVVDISIVLGNNGSNVGHAFTINGTNPTTYGTLTVSPGVTLTLRGTDTTSNTLGYVYRYARFSPQPGSTVLGDTAGNMTSVVQNHGTIWAEGTAANRIVFSVPSTTSAYSWNTAVADTNVWTAANSPYRWGVNLGVINTLTSNWISNAAGTALGSFGDSSLSFANLPAGVMTTEVATVAEVTSPGKFWTNYEGGFVVFWDAGSKPVANVNAAYKTPVLSKTWGINSVDNLDYNQAVFRYCDFSYMGRWAGGAATRAILVAYKNSAASAANRLFDFQHNTVRWCNQPLGTPYPSTLTGTAEDPIRIDNNDFGSIAISQSGAYINASVALYGMTGSYVSVSNNTLNSRKGFISIYHTVIDHLSVLNNNGWTDSLLGTSAAVSDTLGDAIIDGNIATGCGQYCDDSRAINGVGGTAGHIAVISNNQLLHQNRSLFTGSYTWSHHNLLWSYHHCFLVTGQDLYAYYHDVLAENNTIIGEFNDDGGLELTGTQFPWADNIVVRHNTIVAGSNGGIGIGDVGDVTTASSFLTRVSIYDNLVWNATNGLVRPIVPHIPVHAGLSRSDHNYYWGMAAGSVYLNLNRGASFLQGSAFYNESVTRNITGATIWDPSYTTNQTGRSLAFVRTSDSDMALAWDGGVPVQLVYGTYGFGTPDTFSAATNSIANGNGTITVTTTPWTTTWGVATCPRAKWLKISAGTGAGQVMSINNNTVSQLTVTPAWSPVPDATSVFEIIEGEVQLYDSGAVQYVRVQPDPRYLPASSQTDTGIDIVLTDVYGTDALFAGGASRVETGMWKYFPLNFSVICGAADGKSVGVEYCQQRKLMIGNTN